MASGSSREVATALRFGRCGVMTVSMPTIDATLRPAAALANGRDAEPVTGSREERLGNLAYPRPCRNAYRVAAVRELTPSLR